MNCAAAVIVRPSHPAAPRLSNYGAGTVVVGMSSVAGSDSTPRDGALVALPKAHVHVHLLGSMRSMTLRELAGREGIEVTDPPVSFPGWASFHAVYGAAKRVLRDAADLARLVGEVVADAAADGAVWIEISVSPSGYRAITGGDEETMRVLTDAATEASQVHGIGVGLVVAADRVRDAADPTTIVELGARWSGRGVVGFGLAGDEAHPCAPFAPAAATAREAGLLVVPHAGELAGPDSIREVLEHLRPDRIMHGIRAVEDPALVAELVARGVSLDVCPSSNVALGVVDGLGRHPLPELLRAGVRCSINADDTRVFATSLVTEYQRAHELLDLTAQELADVAATSLTSSAAPRPLIDRALHGIERWVAPRSPWRAEATTTSSPPTRVRRRGAEPEQSSR